jgi:hypothetical protein
MLVDGRGAELLASVVREFTMAAVLVDDRGAKLLVMVFTGCVDVIGGSSCSVIPLASHVEAASVDVVGAGSLVVLGTGFLAASSSVVFSVHVEGPSATTGVIGAESLDAVFTGCVDAIGGASCSAIPLASHVEAASVDVVGTGSLGAGSLVVLGIGLLAASSSVVFSSATTGVIGAESLDAVFTGCVDAIGEASCSVVPLASHVEAASVDVVGTGSLGAGSLVALVARFLAAWSSVVFPVSHAEAVSAITAVLALFDPSACPVARFGLSMDFCTAFAILAVMSCLEALDVD